MNLINKNIVKHKQQQIIVTPKVIMHDPNQALVHQFHVNVFYVAKHKNLLNMYQYYPMA